MLPHPSQGSKYTKVTDGDGAAPLLRFLSSTPAGEAEQEQPFLHRGEPIPGNADLRQSQEVPVHLRSPGAVRPPPRLLISLRPFRSSPF